MFREIRNKRNETSRDMAEKLLETCRRGVLSVIGDDGYPYGIPVNFLYSREDGKIWFHGSGTGHKADSLKRCDKVCFTVYGNETVRDEEWAPYVQSTVVFGRCRIITDGEAVPGLVKRFAMKYYPDEALVDEEIAKAGNAVRMYEFVIEHMSGKRVRER